MKLDWRPPQGGIAFLAGCFIVASLYFIATGGDSWYTRYVCPFFLPIGIGLWLKHAWARWITFAFFCLAAVGLARLLFEHGITVRGILQGLIIAGSLFALWEWKVYSADHQND